MKVGSYWSVLGLSQGLADFLGGRRCKIGCSKIRIFDILQKCG